MGVFQLFIIATGKCTLPIALWNPSNMDTPGCPD